jgi:hypothetical protein
VQFDSDLIMATDQKIFIHSPELEGDGYPADCPFNSKRAGKTLETIKANELIQSNDRRVLPAEPIERVTLERFHSAAYLDALQSAGLGSLSPREALDYRFTGRSDSKLCSMGIASGSSSGWTMGGACARGRVVRLRGGGNSIRPRACSFKSNVRAAMSLSRPAPLRQFHRSHNSRDRAVRCQSGCCAINPRTSPRSSPESVRPCRQIASTAPTIYAIARRESSGKCPNSRSLLFVLLTSDFALAAAVAPAPEIEAAAIQRWEKDIAALEARDRIESHPADSILFVGSSSIRMWNTIGTDIAPYHPIPRGYGGARFSDLAVFARRLIAPHRFQALVLFVANDVTGASEDARPEQVAGWFGHIVDIAQEVQPDAGIFCLEITPTPSRWAAWPMIRQVNRGLTEA